MKITVFTSNQPRHYAFIRRLSEIADVYAIQECTTLMPGLVPDYYKASSIMADYFGRVIAAERKVFGSVCFTPNNVRSLSLHVGDLSYVTINDLAPALQSDVYVVFGASFIKGELCDFLMSKSAVNVHMGVSPYYRGNSCNFWAIADGRPDYVGATIHLITAGLDDGPILFHALPAAASYDPFELGMRAVEVAHAAVVTQINEETLFTLEPVPQNRSQELRYTRNKDFHDDVVSKYLVRLPDPKYIGTLLLKRDLSEFIRPWTI